MKPDDEIDEMILVAAFQRRQEIEATKVAALVTAAINPDKAHEAYMAFLKCLMPEYAEIRAKFDQKLMSSFDVDKDRMFVLVPGIGGWSAAEKAIPA